MATIGTTPFLCRNEKLYLRLKQASTQCACNGLSRIEPPSRPDLKNISGCPKNELPLAIQQSFLKGQGGPRQISLTLGTPTGSCNEAQVRPSCRQAFYVSQVCLFCTLPSSLNLAGTPDLHEPSAKQIRRLTARALMPRLMREATLTQINGREGMI